MATNYLHRLWKYFLELNLYKNSTSDDTTIHKERLATRVYTVALAGASLLILVAAASVRRTVNRIEYAPSHARFSQLANTYPNTLSCPCVKFAIAYERFVSARAEFHPVCSSEFVEQRWINTIFMPQNQSSLFTDDVRATLTQFWQIVAGLCVVSSRTWMETMTSFGASRLLSPMAATEQVIASQVGAGLNKHTASSRTKLTHNLLVIRRTIDGNQIVSAMGTNVYLHYPSNASSGDSPKMSPRVFGNCSCLNVQGCPRLASVINSDRVEVLVPGMKVDCLIVDSTLASTLECYYDHACLSLLHGPLSNSVKLLSSRHFASKSTVQMLVDEMMIEEVTHDIRFDLFFAQCNPAYCTYSYTHRFDAVFVITTIIGLFGAESFVLKLLAGLIATRVLQWSNRFQPQERQVLTPLSLSQRGECSVTM